MFIGFELKNIQWTGKLSYTINGKEIYSILYERKYLKMLNIKYCSIQGISIYKSDKNGQYFFINIRASIHT